MASAASMIVPKMLPYCLPWKISSTTAPMIEVRP